MTVSFQNGSFLSGSTSASTSLTSGGVSVSSLYNTDYLDSKYTYNDTKEGYEIASAGRDAAIESDISNFMTYIANGQEDKALEAYEELLEEMSSQTRYAQLVSDDGDDTELRAVAKTLIEETLDEGTTLEDYISNNTRKNASVENQACIWGANNCDSTSQEDLLNETCNLDVEEGHSTIISKAIFSFIGIFAKAGNAVFGDGTKH